MQSFCAPLASEPAEACIMSAISAEASQAADWQLNNGLTSRESLCRTPSA